LADFNKNERIVGNEREIKMNEKERNKYNLENDDILVVRVNGSRDLAGIFISYINPSNKQEAFCDHFIRLRLDKNRILPSYACFVANSSLGRRYIEAELVTSAGQNTVNQRSVFALNILLPSIEEQQEIIKRVENLFSIIAHLETHYQAAINFVNTLSSVLLAKAFRGELVPQNPNDEPADVLLDRIRAERAAAEKEEKTKRVTGAKPRRTRIEELMLKLSEISSTHLTDILKQRGSLTAETLWAASQLEIEDFYDQLKDEELRGLLQEIRNPLTDIVSVLEAL